MKGCDSRLLLFPSLTCLLVAAFPIVTAFVRIVCVDKLAFHVIEATVRRCRDVDELDFERVAISIVRVDIAVAFAREVSIHALRYVRRLTDVVLPVSEVVDDVTAHEIEVLEMAFVAVAQREEL